MLFSLHISLCGGVYHHTSREAIQSILDHRKFRFYNIKKRFGEGEMVTLIKNNSLTGYLDKDENGQSKYETLAESTFYSSFTDTNLTI
jgi:hypothetical protein